MRHARTTRTAPSTTTYWSPSIASTPRGRSVGRSSVCLPHVAETGTSRRSWRKVRVAPLDTNPVVVVHDGYNGSATSKATRGTSCPYTLLVSLVHSPGPPVACLRRSTRGYRSPTNIQCLARFASKVLLGFQWSLRPSGLGRRGCVPSTDLSCPRGSCSVSCWALRGHLSAAISPSSTVTPSGTGTLTLYGSPELQELLP